MKVDFSDKDLEELLCTGKNRKYRNVARNKALMEGLRGVYAIMRAVPQVSSLRNYGRLRYEKLKYDYAGYSSVRILSSHVARLIFTEHEEGLRIVLIELDETHYGNKK